jgi:hypothetical protein
MKRGLCSILVSLVSLASLPALAQEGLPPPAETAPAAAAPAQPAAAQPAAPEALPAPAGAGSVEIVTDQPGAEALVDGARVGKTPVRVDGLSPGVHRVQVTREGGAPNTRDVTVLDGQVSRVDIIIAGGPPRADNGSLGNETPQAAPAAAPQSSGGSKFGLPGREFFSTFLEQPWAWVAAGICAVALLAAALMWTIAGPKDIPLVGNYINVDVPSNVWLAARVTALAVAALFGVGALILFVWPSLPFAKWVPLPDLNKILGFKKDPPPAAPAPAPAK